MNGGGDTPSQTPGLFLKTITYRQGSIRALVDEGGKLALFPMQGSQYPAFFMGNAVDNSFGYSLDFGEDPEDYAEVMSQVNGTTNDVSAVPVEGQAGYVRFTRGESSFVWDEEETYEIDPIPEPYE